MDDFMTAAENVAPCEKYVMKIIPTNMAGNITNMPPMIGPPIFVINTAKTITNPLNTALKIIMAGVYRICLPASELTFKPFSTIVWVMTTRQM